MYLCVVKPNVFVGLEIGRLPIFVVENLLAKRIALPNLLLMYDFRMTRVVSSLCFCSFTVYRFYKLKNTGKKT